MYAEIWGLVRSAVALGDWSWAWSYASSCEDLDEREALERYVWRAAQDDRAARRSVACGELICVAPELLPHPDWRPPDPNYGHNHYALACGLFVLFVRASRPGPGVVWSVVLQGKPLREGSCSSLFEGQIAAQECLRELLVPALGFVF